MQIAALFFAVILPAAFYLFYDLPAVDEISAKLNPPSVKITDRNGNWLYEVLPNSGGRNIPLSSEKIPPCIKNATIAVEDKTFYQNPGVDLSGILRALWINLQGRETLAGGSTITQQVARNLLLSNEKTERTLRRKLRETILAWQLTRKYSKDEILALYLNQIYYGGMAYGIEAAAQTYFGKPASELLLPECALLAGLPQTPGVYNPFTNPDLALERQRVVLGLMEANGFITAAQRMEAEAAPLSYNPLPYPIHAPHFVWMVTDQLDALYAQGKIPRHQSLTVRTTLDLNMQTRVEEIVARRLEAFKPKAGEINRNVNNAAVVVMNPQTGEVLSLLGSADYFNAEIHGAVNMAITPRQSGSAFKPVIYAAAFDPLRAQPLTAATNILDAKAAFKTKDGQPYQPVNYDNREHGLVTAREALGSSLNIPAVLVLQNVGIENSITLANQLGIHSLGEPQNYDLSLALGGGEISLLELTGAYSAFANGGAYAERILILEIYDADGNLLYEHEATPPRQVMDARVAWLITDILSDDRARLIGFGLNSVLKIDRPAAVKTGTTTNFHDNWTIGYTPNLAVGVWVGNSDYKAMRNVSGLTGAAPIWHETIRALLQGKPEAQFTQPGGLIFENGEWWIEGTKARGVETVFDASQTLSGWENPRGETRLVLTSPADNVTYQITPRLPLSAQQVMIAASADEEIYQVTFFMNGVAMQTLSAPPFEMWWQLAAGRHEIWAEGITSAGETIKSNVVNINVLGQ